MRKLSMRIHILVYMHLASHSHRQGLANETFLSPTVQTHTYVYDLIYSIHVWQTTRVGAAGHVLSGSSSAYLLFPY
jgi:hypothetical protein